MSNASNTSQKSYSSVVKDDVPENTLNQAKKNEPTSSHALSSEEITIDKPTHKVIEYHVPSKDTVSEICIIFDHNKANEIISHKTVIEKVEDAKEKISERLSEIGEDTRLRANEIREKAIKFNEEAKEKTNDFGHRVQEFAHDTKENVTEYGQAVKEKTADAIHHAIEKVEDMYEGAKEKIVHTFESIKHAGHVGVEEVEHLGTRIKEKVIGPSIESIELEHKENQRLRSVLENIQREQKNISEYKI